WLGWVPLLYALRGAGPGMGLLLGWVAGTLCFAGGSYWLAQFMINLKQVNPGLSLVLAALFWSYLGLTLGLTSMLYRWLVRRLGGCELRACPLWLVVGMRSYPMVFTARLVDGKVRVLRAR